MTPIVGVCGLTVPGFRSRYRQKPLSDSGMDPDPIYRQFYTAIATPNRTQSEEETGARSPSSLSSPSKLLVFL